MFLMFNENLLTIADFYESASQRFQCMINKISQ